MISLTRPFGRMAASRAIAKHHDQIVEHYRKAVGKHRFFAHKLTWLTQEEVYRTLLKVRSYNDSERNEVDAISLLDEETLEMLEAYYAANPRKAIDEAYDAIAVILRIIERLKKEPAGRMA